MMLLEHAIQWIVDPLIEFKHAIDAGFGLSFWTQVSIKATIVAGVVVTIAFVRDPVVLRGRSVRILRCVRMWAVLANLGLLLDYMDNGWAKHLMVANSYASLWALLICHRITAGKLHFLGWRKPGNRE